MRKIRVINKDFVQFLRNRDNANVDFLTQLRNRRGMYAYYDMLDKSTLFSVFFIDIDDFKKVNDVYGHSVGDDLLRTLAGYFKEQFPDSGIYRIGGDEFVAFEEGKKSEPEAIAHATRMLNGIRTINFREDVRQQLTLSVGIIMNQNPTADLDEILKKCDNAMYRAKKKGKNSCVIFNSLEDEMKKNSEIEEEMEAAYTHNEFVPYLLPKVNVLTKQVLGAELLVRWVHWLDGVRNPEKFIPVFEKNGSIAKLDLYMFEAACRMMDAWKGTPLEDTVLSVNFSPVTFYMADLKEKLREIADRYDVRHEKLEIELPGKTYTNTDENITDLVKGLKGEGFLVALDNFGGIYSPLTAVKDLNIDSVKFDRDFIRSATEDQRGTKILRNLFTLCKDMKVDIVAVGVETEEQAKTLLGCGCYKAEGYYYSEPQTEEEFIKYALSNSSNRLKPIRFSFNGTLISEDGNFVAETIPAAFDGKMSFAPGPKKNTGSIHFPGSEQIKTNILQLPNDVLKTESWTVCFWVKPDELSKWTTVLYIKCEIGFISFAPMINDENCCYRIRDSRDASEWIDTKGPIFKAGEWYHVSIGYDAEKEEAVLYLNGKAVSYTNQVPTQRYVCNFWLGGDPYRRSFVGDVSELVIYPEVRSAEEIEKLYEAY